MSKDNDEIDMAEISAKFKTGFFNTIDFFKNNKYALSVVLIIIAMFFSIHFRMYPSHLPITDQWAENSIHNQIRSQISSQITQQYPNLPDSHKQRLIETDFANYLKENKASIEPQIKQLSDYFRSNFQNEDGDTYLTAIDPFFFYGQGVSYVECGNPGCHPAFDENGSEYYGMIRDGRNFPKGEMSGESYLGVGLYYMLNIFGNFSVMRAFFFIPIIFVALAVIPAFFLGKKLGGNLGGFVSGMIVAINGSLLGRTPGGFADNDGAIILFPLLAIWFLTEFIEAKTLKNKIIFASSGALSFVLMSTIWPTQHLFVAIISALIMYLGLIGVVEFIKSQNFVGVYKAVKSKIMMPFIYILTSLVTLTVLVDWKYLINLLSPLISFVVYKRVAFGTAWPNVMVTVAELNTRPYSYLVSSMGGNLLVALSIIGLLLLFFLKDEEKKSHLLLACAIFVWTVATVFSFSRGIRFAILVVPSFAIGLGTALGLGYRYGSKWLTHELHLKSSLSKSLLIFIVFMLFILPVTPSGSLIGTANNIALNQIPSFNDAWDDTLTRVKVDANDGYGYLTTWWDFGHWFTAKGIRVTFDGGNHGLRIHWVGNSLLTDDEHVSVSILRMLNCGQDKGPQLLDKYLENDTIKAVSLTYETIVEDRETAQTILEREGLPENLIQQYLDYTHCDDEILFPHYYITSEDMVGKAGVWGHFGSWDFTRATMWQTIRGTSFENGSRLLVENFSVPQENAANMYYEIQRTNAENWITGWPGYLSDRSRCSEIDGLIRCENGVDINITTMKASVLTQQGRLPLTSISYINSAGEFINLKFNDSNAAPYSVLLLPDLTSIITDPLQAASMFTRLFYFDGHGLKHFRLFYDTVQITGGRILTWKIDWDNTTPIMVYSLPEPDDDSELIISTDDSFIDFEFDDLIVVEE
jgi:dolichyl-phosphooligosaccharide-protein glycotransferase